MIEPQISQIFTDQDDKLVFASVVAAVSAAMPSNLR